MKFTPIKGHYQTFESFPSRRNRKEQRKKSQTAWNIKKGTKLMQIKTETTKAEKRDHHQSLILKS